MSHFYGTLQGNRGEATRCGSKASGVTTYAAGWGGAVRVTVYEQDGEDRYSVSLTPWQSSGGQSRLLAEGKLDATEEVTPPTEDIWKQIREFSDECEARQGTDIGEVWNLLDRIYNLAGGPVVNDCGPQV